MPRNTDWEGIEREYRAGRGHYPLGEDGPVKLLKELCSANQMELMWDLPVIAMAQHEFPFPRGRADFVLFHVDGSATVIEVKDAGSERSILAGIGQLMLYSVQLGYARALQRIRCILTVPIAGNDPMAYTIAKACTRAGVLFEPLGPMWEHEVTWPGCATEEERLWAAASVNGRA